MKKLLIIALIALASLCAAVPDSKAGVSIGIGFGFPGFYTYPGYYPYAYPAVYPPVPVYYRVGFGPYYWWHGHRVYYRQHHRYWR